MVERRQTVTFIFISSLLLFSLVYRSPQLLSLHCGKDVDLDGFQNDPAIAKNIDMVTDIQNSNRQLILQDEADGCPSSSHSHMSFYWVRKHNLLWCKVPKAGSTSWTKNILKLVGTQYDFMNDINVDEEDRGFVLISKHAVFDIIFPPFPLSKAQEIVNSTLSFMIVRHPLDRLLASYLDKRDLGKDWDEGVGNRSWPQFVQHMLEIPKERWNKHWAPIHILCPPCIRYDVIARMETFVDDSKYIIHRAGLSNILQVPWENKQRVGSSFERNLSFYRMLSVEQVQALVNIYRLDFELYGYDPEPFLWMASQDALEIHQNQNSSTHMRQQNNHHSSDIPESLDTMPQLQQK